MSDNNALSKDEAFEKLGHITRQLHQAMTELGIDVQLHQIAHEIPDARDRLSYVGQMTETAAHKVLGLVEEARPGCAHLAEHAQGQQRDLTRLLAEHGDAATNVRDGLRHANDFAGAVIKGAAEQESALSAIMMTQDFQDLSGQVIKKVIDIISRTEAPVSYTHLTLPTNREV